MKKAFLILQDGRVFEGKHFGADKNVISEIVFNTSMAGYLEVLTDPSYAGQAVCMTYPMIGNYGVITEDCESGKAWPDALIVRQLARMGSNFRMETTLEEYLIAQGVPGIEGIDTRALTRHLRESGTMNGMITTDENYDLDAIKAQLAAYTVTGVVREVSCKEAYSEGEVISEANGNAAGWVPEEKPYEKRLVSKKPEGKLIALMDFGAKRNIVKSLARRGNKVVVFPAWTKAEEVLAIKPDGIMLSNGPGDPAENVEIIAEIKKLYDSEVPIFAICLGHQLMALATGAKTYKLKYGHRGGNHPVKDHATGRVYITSQNHGYAVDTDSLDPQVAEPAFSNVNDGTNEGLKYVGKKIFTVQFHPECCPGPQDTDYLFDRFMKMMEE